MPRFLAFHQFKDAAIWICPRRTLQTLSAWKDEPLDVFSRPQTKLLPGCSFGSLESELSLDAGMQPQIQPGNQKARCPKAKSPNCNSIPRDDGHERNAPGKDGDEH